MTRWSASILFGILIATTMLGWLPDRWPTSVLEIGAFSLAIAWLVAAALGRGQIRVNPMILAVGFVPAWGLMQLVTGHTAQAAATMSSILNWLCYTALFLIATQIAQEPAVQHALLRKLLIFGAVVCVIAIVQAFTSPGRVFWFYPEPDSPFIMGPFLYHTHYATFIELLLPLALIGAAGGRNRLAYAAVAGAMFASIIVSASRGGFVIITLETVTVMALLAWRDRQWRTPVRLLTTVLLTAAVFTTIVGWNVLWERFHKTTALYGREQMLRSSIDMYRDHPWLGVGLGAWTVVYPEYARYDDGLFANAAHSDWAQWASEGGIAVLVCIGILAVWAARQAIRSIWGIGVVFVLIHAAFDYPLQNPQIAALTFVLLGLSTRIGGRSAREESIRA